MSTRYLLHGVGEADEIYFVNLLRVRNAVLRILVLGLIIIVDIGNLKVLTEEPCPLVIFRVVVLAVGANGCSGV